MGVAAIAVKEEFVISIAHKLSRVQAQGASGLGKTITPWCYLRGQAGPELVEGSARYTQAKSQTRVRPRTKSRSRTTWLPADSQTRTPAVSGFPDNPKSCRADR